jgi:GT2 family glycosyltransferase
MSAALGFFALCAAYLVCLMLFAVTLRRRVPAGFGSGRNERPSSERVSVLGAPGGARFTILIPAHNEQQLIADTLASLQALEYPPDRVRVVVIADNCTDRTAEICRAMGARVLERTNTERIGKGYALEWALRVLDEAVAGSGPGEDEQAARPDAVVVLDADTLVSPALLTEFDRRLRAGESVLQAAYLVLNARETWRTRLMACALALAHVVKPLGRERLGLSDGLKGNGMCFAVPVVRAVPWSGESITEDIEYTVRLCRAGFRVAFVPEATVWAQMPATGKQAASQRRRWEGGRYGLVFGVAPRMLLEAVRRRDRTLTDRAVELVIPPFAEMVVGPMAGLLVCLALAGWTHSGWARGLSAGWMVVLAMQALYLGGGLWVARVPRDLAASLIFAPFYVLWKMGQYAVMAAAGGAGGWKRTARH